MSTRVTTQDIDSAAEDSEGTWITLPDCSAFSGTTAYPENYPLLPKGIPASHAVYRLLGALSGFSGQSSQKSEGRFLCPVHPDTDPSLDVWIGGDSRPVVMKCWGCGATGPAVCEALDLPTNVLFDPLGFDPAEVDWRFTFSQAGAEKRGGQKWRDRPIAVGEPYIYKLEDGSPNYRITRKEGTRSSGKRAKVFVSEAWDAESETYVGGLGALDLVSRTPYLLEQFAAWRNADKPLYLVEGEKDVNRLVAEGFAATTFSHGANSKLPLDWEHWFAGFNVHVVADRDDPGFQRAEALTTSLNAAGVRFQIVASAWVTPLSHRGADVSDHLDSGLSMLELTELSQTPGEDSAEPAGLRYVAWNSDRFWDPTPPRFLIPGVLAEGQVGTIYSGGGLGKSLLLQDAAIGLTLRGTVFGIPVKRVPVLYIDRENSMRSLSKRVTAMGFPGSIPEGLHYSMLGDWPALDTKAGGALLLSEVLRTGAKLVILDTMSKLVEGDENANDTWTGLHIRTMVGLKDLGVAVQQLDHSGKDTGKGQRGGSAKQNNADVVWNLTATRNGVRLKNEKDRDGDYGGIGSTLFLERRTDPLEHVLVEPSSVGPVTAGNELAVDEIVEFVTEHPGCSQNMLETGVRRKREVVRSARDLAVDQNLITTKPGAHGAKQHWPA